MQNHSASAYVHVYVYRHVDCDCFVYILSVPSLTQTAGCTLILGTCHYSHTCTQARLDSGCLGKKKKKKLYDRRDDASLRH